ncbi:MAG: hypothetical protein KKD86_06135, partial [Bacteroidetes bacterium]|nr:hypothetical protein [Bacteroidota bacterium]
MTKIYKLSLEQKSGLLTPLQSDTIFGQFCWQLKRTLGEDKLASFLELYENNQPVFTLSDGLYEYNGEVLFPKPRLLFKEDINLISKKDKIKSFLINKEIKSINYIHVLALNHFLNNRQQEFRNSFSNQKSTKIPESFTDLRISVQIDRATFTSVDSKLFSYNPAYLKKNKKEDKIEYAVLVKSLNEIAFSDF